MIIDIPTPSSFHAASIRQIHLAWKIVMQHVHDYNNSTYEKLADETPKEAACHYWQRSQPAMANAFSLVQQGMELALKGKISMVSPFLLLGDPKDWPGRVVTEAVSFGEFNTLDASSLVKVHNAVSPTPLNERFMEFWTRVRIDRNKIMHSPAPEYFDPPQVIRTVLEAVYSLYAEEPWPQRLLKLELESKSAALGYHSETFNIVMRELDDAINNLPPAEALRYLNFDKARRAYVCPHCYFAANRDWQDEWPRLAQFTERKRAATELHCILCDRTLQVERAACESTGCPGDVIDQGICLTCTKSQENS